MQEQIMITINQLKIALQMPCGAEKNAKIRLDSPEILRKKAAKILGIQESKIQDITIRKHSIDARKKPLLFQVYTLGISLQDNKYEEQIVKRCKDNNVVFISQSQKDNNYCFSVLGNKTLRNPPVIIGMGPAGLFAGYMLAKYGYQPILCERGYDVDTRTKDVESFWNDGVLHPDSNVQFGEGGAGTFSDGKLNTLVKDKNGRNKEVLRIFAECGAPKEILFESKPHIGTDILKTVVKNMREFILNHGGTVHFGTKMTALEITAGAVSGVVLNHKEVIKTNQVILAIGHSARDTFTYLNELAVPMEAKAFAVGMRVEHPQQLINECMYGKKYGKFLPAAPYKLTAQTSTGRGVYSFCMCPGGYVVNASSEAGRLAVNGMSYSDRSGTNANSAIIVQVTPDDYPSSDPLAGVAFQKTLEEKAFALGNGRVPVQYYGDYIKNQASKVDLNHRLKKNLDKDMHSIVHKISPCIKGEYIFTNLRGLLPEECEKAFIEAMKQFDKTIPGFAGSYTILSGIESRTSSPVRICRDETMQSPAFVGLYPCGEGAGYAGGITSAAMDGILVAERIAAKYQPLCR